MLVIHSRNLHDYQYYQYYSQLYQRFFQNKFDLSTLENIELNKSNKTNILDTN